MATTSAAPARLLAPDPFLTRHVAPSADEQQAMLAALGHASLDAFIDAVVPETIRFRGVLAAGPGADEAEALAELRGHAARNEVRPSYLGMGYHGTHVPPVIQRNVLENPGWYTAYTPYQAEIAQGRLEALLNYQTMVMELTGMEIANASLLDEGTAAAEAVAMLHAVGGSEARTTVVVAADCHPQTIDVVRTRADAKGWPVLVQDVARMTFGPETCAVLLQYPTTFGSVEDYRAVVERAHAAGALVIVASDLLALTLLTPPGEWGADVVVGNSQRFGVPMGYGGPHAAFFAAREAYKRHLPGRIIGVSKDAAGRPALRMALQTREQHIRREKATSNVCTAQVLLSVMAGMYAVWHGPQGLRKIAQRVHQYAQVLAAGAERLGLRVVHDVFFDTVLLETGARHGAIVAAAEAAKINVRIVGDGAIGIALDETVTPAALDTLLAVLNGGAAPAFDAESLAGAVDLRFDERFARTSPFLTHPVFHAHHAEHEMLRYLRTLEGKDLSLAHSMIPLGSCTMKLNATAEMFPVTWPQFGQLHPFAPTAQAQGYRAMFDDLERWLADVTGFAAVSLQPNAGSQGE
ncbi:MAG: glycine dehydrogenase (aminomethyl-transferring), partial [Gemmatimonadaceae bacterium]|nr:glycine dehydrogenase (aminomethyl-transferring) [Gemmatimonadaceae bacterium]